MGISINFDNVTFASPTIPISTFLVRVDEFSLLKKYKA